MTENSDLNKRLSERRQPQRKAAANWSLTTGDRFTCGRLKFIYVNKLYALRNAIAAYTFLCGAAPSSFASRSINLDGPVTSMPLGVLVTTRRDPKVRKVKEWPDLRMRLDCQTDRSRCVSQVIFDPVRRQNEGGTHGP